MNDYQLKNANDVLSDEVNHKSEQNPMSLSTNDIFDMESYCTDKCNKTTNDMVYSSLTTVSYDTYRLLNDSEYGMRSLPSTNSRSYAKQLMIDLFPVLGMKRKTVSYFQKTSSSITLTEASRNQYNDLWVGSLNLRRTAKPNLENEYHLENSLKLSILEARDIPAKRSYYCDISLDGTLYARTTSKTAVSGIFWAEDFDLNNLPNVSMMTISLYRDGGSVSKDGRRVRTSKISLKKYRKVQNQLIGYITIHVSEISSRTGIQAWLTLQPPSVENTSSQDNLHNHLGAIVYSNSNRFGKLNSGKAIHADSSSLNTFNNSSGNNNNNHHGTIDQRNFPQIRIRARYQSLGILPLCNYWPLRTLILKNSLILTNWLESLLAVKFKEEIANSLVYLHEHNNTLIDFLTSLVVREVSNLENESMAFRSNTIATKAVECYVKFVGSSYLHHLLHLLIQHVLTCFTSWEVDPEKLSSSQCSGGTLTSSDTTEFALSPGNMLKCFRPIIFGSLIANQIMLLRYFDVVWRSIQSSLDYFPSELIQLFSSFRKALEKLRGSEFCDNLISGCIFLRLICPALLSPSLFGLISAFPSEPACQRNLTLLAKSLQSLANFSTFDDKEPYMRFLNGYVTCQLSNMRFFIRSISSRTLNHDNGNVDDVVGTATTTTTAAVPVTDTDCVTLLPKSCRQQTSSSSSSITKKTLQCNIKDTIDENCELANIHLILSDVLFPDTLTFPGNVTPMNAIMNNSNDHFMTDTKANNSINSSMDSQSMHEMVPLVFLKDVDITVMASLPDELSSLPRILDDISRVLQRNSSSGCMDYAKTMCSVNNHNNLNHIGFNGIQESRQSGFSPSLLGNDGFTDDDKGHQSISSLHDQYHRHHHRHTPKSLSPHYTLHYNPGFHNPSIPGGQKSVHRLLIPQLKQSTSLTGLPSDVSKPNLNDYDEPYISPESDCEANDDFTVSDHEINNKKTQITDKFTFQCHSSLSITNGSESKSNSSSKERKTYDQKSISLDKLNHLDDEHIYDTVPSPSSSSSVSTEGLSSVNKLNRLDKLSSQSNQIPNNNNNNNDELLTSSRHQSLNTDKINSLQINNSVMLESKFNEQISSSSSLSPTLSVSSSSSSLLMNKLTSSETVQYDEISEFSTTKSISPRLFPKQVTTANVVLTKPNIMSSSSVDSTKISKLTTHFRPRSSSRENTFDRNVNGYHFSFGVANTVKVNPSHCFPNHSSNKIVGSVGNDSVNSVYDTQMYRRNASTEQLCSHSSNSNSNIHELEGSCSPHLNTNNNNEQPSELAIEVARLRHELLLSRKDAMRAADRLSKQETEIYQLRQLLEQLSGVNSNDNSSVNLKAQNAITSQPSVHSNVNLHTNQLNNTYTNGVRSADSRKPTTVGVSSCLQNSMNTDSKVVDTVTATFKELDDAMARLELEQTELLREQARIRARIAATHRAQSIVNSTSPPSNKSTSRPKHFEMSIPKISINSRHHHELRSPGHMDYSNSQRIIRHMNKIHSEVKNIPK